MKNTNSTQNKSQTHSAKQYEKRLLSWPPVCLLASVNKTRKFEKIKEQYIGPNTMLNN